MTNITFASAQIEISISECSTCHKDTTFNAFSVNRSNTCDAKCHGNPSFDTTSAHYKFIDETGVMTDYGWFESNLSANTTAPEVHNVHSSVYMDSVCSGCHLNTNQCSNCHINDDVFHITHGSSTINPVYACDSELCHNLNFTTKYYWEVAQPKPVCENCHNDQISVSRHNITISHQSALTPDCQTCHSSYLPDAHADIANRSYNDDSCAVCHQSTNTTVKDAITNNDTSCASCHTLHGDITEIHTLNTTTSTLKCPDCHQNTYLPELHDNFSAVNNLPTNCSVCHNNVNLTISIATAECTTCHDSQLDAPHLNANHTSVSECIVCHDADLSIEHLDNCSVCHTNPTKVDIDSATNDCRSCHVDQNVEYHSNMDDNHTSSTAECIICHETDLPIVHLDNCSVCHANPTVIDMNSSTADCNSCHVDQNVGFHTDMSAKHTQTSTCINCHTDSYLPDLHNDFALANEMTNCTICHDNTKVSTDNATSDCITCHGQQLPTQHANEVAKHTTDACAECHGSVDGSYLPYTHNATEENGRCDLCHSNVAINMSISTSNCTSCHGPQVNEPHYNALEKHKFESPVECLVCHDRYIPTAHTDQYGNTNCLLCHGNNPAITYLPTDKNCSSCHGAQLPAEHGDLTVVHTATASPGCVRCHETKNVLTIHDDECSTCHGSTLIPTLPSTVECKECHGENALLPAHDSRGNPKR